MHTGVNKTGSWLVKWLKLEAYIPNLVGERDGGEKAYMERTNRFL